MNAEQAAERIERERMLTDARWQDNGIDPSEARRLHDDMDHLSRLLWDCASEDRELAARARKCLERVFTTANGQTRVVATLLIDTDESPLTDDITDCIRVRIADDAKECGFCGEVSCVCDPCGDTTLDRSNG